MKTIEQKALAYDEAIKKIKYVMEHGVQPVLNKEDLQGIFPELQESEDERIRKTLIDFFNRGAENGAQTNGVYDKDILAWLEKLKEIEQKSVWSEEDEKNCSGIIDEIAVNKSEAPESDYKTYDRFIDWLKSLRHKNGWKPSEEQMEALEHFIRGVGESGYASPYDANLKLVHSLLNDLKKTKIVKL